MFISVYCFRGATSANVPIRRRPSSVIAIVVLENSDILGNMLWHVKGLDNILDS